MKRPGYPWNLKSVLTGKPTIGWHLELCEDNYRLLLRLAPGIRELDGCYLSRVNGAMDLYLEVLEQTPYTTLVHLTYYFEHESGQLPDPDATVRIYHDSRQAEVLDLRQSALPLNPWSDVPTLQQKWKIGLFLSKWLSFCVRQRHIFSPASLVSEQGRGSLTTA